MTLVKGIFVGALTVIATFAVIVPLDTVMWNNYSSPMLPPLPFLWAEGVVLFYNTIENKSANWGTSPFYWYLIALVKALLGCFVFALLGVFKVSGQQYKRQSKTNYILVTMVYVKIFTLGLGRFAPSVLANAHPRFARYATATSLSCNCNCNYQPQNTIPFRRRIIP